MSARYLLLFSGRWLRRYLLPCCLRQGQRPPIDEPSILISCRLITSKGTLDALLVILSPADKSAEITKMHVHLFIKQTDVDE